MSSSNEENEKVTVEQLRAFLKQDPYISPELVDAATDGAAEEMRLEAERPHASTKPFGMRTYTQIGPVMRAVLLGVHDNLHGIDRAATYERDKKGRLMYRDEARR